MEIRDAYTLGKLLSEGNVREVLDAEFIFSGDLKYSMESTDTYWYLMNLDGEYDIDDREIFSKYGIEDPYVFCKAEIRTDKGHFPGHETFEGICNTVMQLFIWGESRRYERFDWDAVANDIMSIPVLKAFCTEQILQGNTLNPVLFILEPATPADRGGFNWEMTENGYDFYDDLTRHSQMDEETFIKWSDNFKYWQRRKAGNVGKPASTYTLKEKKIIELVEAEQKEREEKEKKD